MIRISTTQLWVHDQDEALAFWRDRAGFEVREDVTVPEMGNFRWLSVAPPGQDDIAIVLMAIPGPPMIDAGTSEEMSARGAEVTEKPNQQPYGIDCGFRDPSGNSVRLAQRSPMG